ncbi:hypothetical protein BD408DRAFT_467252, partial [Parasitella parasitica]
AICLVLIALGPFLPFALAPKSFPGLLDHIRIVKHWCGLPRVPIITEILPFNQILVVGWISFLVKGRLYLIHI